MKFDLDRYGEFQKAYQKESDRSVASGSAPAIISRKMQNGRGNASYNEKYRWVQMKAAAPR
jgi:hypothetical protein